MKFNFINIYNHSEHEFRIIKYVVIIIYSLWFYIFSHVLYLLWILFLVYKFSRHQHSLFYLSYFFLLNILFSWCFILYFFFREFFIPRASVWRTRDRWCRPRQLWIHVRLVRFCIQRRWSSHCANACPRMRWSVCHRCLLIYKKISRWLMEIK